MLFQSLEFRKKLSRLLWSQNSRGLIQNDNFRTSYEYLQNFHFLLLPYGQIPDSGIRVQMEIVSFGRLPYHLDSFFFIKKIPFFFGSMPIPILIAAFGFSI